MLAAQPALLKSKIAASPAPLPLAAMMGRHEIGKMRMTQMPGFSSKSGRAPAIRAVISSDDKSIGTAQPSAGTSGSPKLSPSSSVIDVKAVITVRKKMKERLTEKIEDQWESFINGIGQGIIIRLVSEEVDPGLFMNFSLFLKFSVSSCLDYVKFDGYRDWRVCLGKMQYGF